MRNEDTLLVHSTYGKGGMMAMVALFFSSSEMGARGEVVLGHSPPPSPKGEKGRKGQSDWRCEEGARWRTLE